MYRCPADYADGLAIDYRCADLDIAPALAAIASRAPPLRPHAGRSVPHLCRDSARDLAAAFALLEPGGALVVHDCLPPNEALAVPDFKPGAWCGVTYKAFSTSCWPAPRPPLPHGRCRLWLRRDPQAQAAQALGCSPAPDRALASGASAKPPGRVLAGARRRLRRRLAPVRAEQRRAAEPDLGRCVPRRSARSRRLAVIARPRAGHPIPRAPRTPYWMAGTSPAMTIGE